MTDSHTNPTNARDSQISPTITNINATIGSRNNMSTLSNRRARASSLDSFSMPAFTKSSTMSTMSTTSSSRSDFITPSVPRTSTHKENASIDAGTFSKPRVNPRSRRSESSARMYSGNGGEDFRYYGRHANQWLFNDFSVTESIKKGWGKVFGKDGEEGDWYEKRN